MCEECFQELIYKFETYKDFDAFEEKIQAKCNEGKLQIIDTYKTDSLSAFDSNLYFECTTCKELWVLNIPENAWRGYFLPLDKAIAYKESLKKLDKKRLGGCLILIVFISIVLSW